MTTRDQKLLRINEKRIKLVGRITKAQNELEKLNEQRTNLLMED